MAVLDAMGASPKRRGTGNVMTNAVASKMKKEVGSQKYKAKETATDKSMGYGFAKTKEFEENPEEKK